MPWFCPANRKSHTSHRIHITSHACFAENYILNRFRLFLRNILRRNDRRRLRFIFRFFLSGICFHMNIFRGNPIPLTFIRPYTRHRHHQMN